MVGDDEQSGMDDGDSKSTVATEPTARQKERKCSKKEEHPQEFACASNTEEGTVENEQPSGAAMCENKSLSTKHSDSTIEGLDEGKDNAEKRRKESPQPTNQGAEGIEGNCVPHAPQTTITTASVSNDNIPDGEVILPHDVNEGVLRTVVHTDATETHCTELLSQQEQGQVNAPAEATLQSLYAPSVITLSDDSAVPNSDDVEPFPRIVSHVVENVAVVEDEKLPNLRCWLNSVRKIDLEAFVVFAVVAACAVVLLIVVIIPILSGCNHADTSLPPLPDLESPTFPPTPSPARPYALSDFVERLAQQNVTDDITLLLKRDTPQFKALQWLAKEDPFVIKPDAPNLVQRFVLMTIYFATAGHAWESIIQTTDYNAFLPTGNLAATPWKGGCHECEWSLVQCGDIFDFSTWWNGNIDIRNESATSSAAETCLHPREYYYLNANQDGVGFVSGLRLHSLSLSGSLPAEIGLLPHLRYLDLRHNHLVGTIPIELYQLTKLEYLLLGLNNFQGTIHKNIGNLSKLESLVLHNNQFDGGIPRTIENAVNLRWIIIHSTRLAGFPLDTLANFLHLEMFECLSSGTIPRDIGKLSSLWHFIVQGYDVDGTLPTELGLLESLESFGLGFTAVTGSIPTEIGSLKKSSSIIFGDNALLQGTIPTTIGRLSALRELRIEGNSLVGNIPSELGDLSLLEVLYLNRNGLSGVIPSELGRLHSLDELRLQYNDLMGTVPKEICNLVLQRGLDFWLDCRNDIDCGCCKEMNCS